MRDLFDREINYLRISVTDKCNLRCRYCMPAEGVPLKRHDDLISFEEITAVVEAGIGLGIRKVRLTGGEPLVRRGIVDLVSMLHRVAGIQTLAMTTNGILLDRFAGALKEAGLDSVNISLDTLDPERYHYITRIGSLEKVLSGIEAARRAGFSIKINSVVMDDTEETEIRNLRRFCREKGLVLQLINHYSLDSEKLQGYHFDRPPDCAGCNRIRLLADGTLKPCLHSDLEIPFDPKDPRESIRRTILSKPKEGTICTNRDMVGIGG
ncbi:MAG: radical SAM protein [Spirochaetales bacterium]|nr:radical SAM protein [Spirochaetales bacterium]MCF7939463.1 radical SAM protein [Spirochaetales bacterium]